MRLYKNKNIKKKRSILGLFYESNQGVCFFIAWSVITIIISAFIYLINPGWFQKVTVGDTIIDKITFSLFVAIIIEIVTSLAGVLLYIIYYLINNLIDYIMFLSDCARLPLTKEEMNAAGFHELTEYIDFLNEFYYRPGVPYSVTKEVWPSIYEIFGIKEVKNFATSMLNEKDKNKKAEYKWICERLLDHCPKK